MHTRPFASRVLPVEDVTADARAVGTAAVAVGVIVVPDVAIGTPLRSLIGPSPRSFGQRSRFRGGRIRHRVRLVRLLPITKLPCRGLVPIQSVASPARADEAAEPPSPSVDGDFVPSAGES